jgi:hypothetical protein
VTDSQFRDWLARDNSDRCVLVEMDYVYELEGAPAVGTLYLSDKVYFDGNVNSPVTGPYIDCVNSVPQFSRSLTGDNLGGYTSSIGTLEIDNADGDQDFLLDLAIDGSDIRFYYGDVSWHRSDFVLIFSALSSVASAPSFDRISVQLKDTGLLLNQSIGGVSLVGGVGANANQARPVNFGYVHNLEALVLDSALLIYVHSDTGDGTAATDVRDRGVAVTFTDAGDGTFTLDASPAGTITCDVVATPSPDSPAGRLVSDAMLEFVGFRAGLLALGKYAGAGDTFTAGDDDDYPVGISIPSAQNVIDLLGDITSSGNCFWAILRTGEFTFGRLRPNDIASLLLGSPTPETTSMVEDDIDAGSFRLDHAVPQYYQFQAYMSKNWLVQTDLASSLTPDEQAVYRRDGIYLLQDPSVGVSYNDAPQLYNKSLAVSPVLDTLLSGAFDELDLPFLETWMDTRRAMFLPWIETVTLTTGIDFYELELGDIVNLTMARFGDDDGVLFQVISINLKLSAAKIDFKLVRRRLLSDPPPEWTQVTQSLEDTPLPFSLGLPQVVVIDPGPVITPPGSALTLGGDIMSPGSGGATPSLVINSARSAYYTPPALGATDGYMVIQPTGPYLGDYTAFGNPADVLAQISWQATVPTITDTAFSVTRPGVIATMDSNDKYEYSGTTDTGGYFWGPAIGVPAYSWEWTGSPVDLNNYSLGGVQGGVIYAPTDAAGLFSAQVGTFSLRSWVFTANRQEYVVYIFSPLANAFGAPHTIGLTTRSLLPSIIGGYTLPPIQPYPAAGAAWVASDWPLPYYRLDPKLLPRNCLVKVGGAAVTSAIGSVTTTIAAGAVPSITSAPGTTAPHGTPFSFQITATNGPTSFASSAMPAGVTFNTSSGLYGGVPTSSGTTPCTQTATNSNGTSAGHSFLFVIT